MTTLTNGDFMSPYEVSKYLSGVIEGRKFDKNTFITDQFGNRDTFDSDTYNVDRENDQKNVMGAYVHPKADGGYIQLPDFGSQELRPAYVKESIQSDDFITLNQRALGQAFGQVDLLANDARNLQKKLSNALSAMDNLKEKAAMDIVAYGTHTASGPKASTVAWNFNRTSITTDTAFQLGYVPHVDLTTLTSNGGAGKKAWDSTGGTKAPTPYKDIKVMIQTAKARGKILNMLVMDTNAYQALEDDIEAKYSKAADLTLAVQQRIDLKIIPMVETYRGVTFQRMLSFQGGVNIPVYTYTGAYNDRITGVETKYMPTGYVLGIPEPRYQIVRYGRIQHRKASWQAMPVWINTWTEGRTGEIEQELHSSYIMAPLDPDSVISWKVSTI